MKQVGRNIFPHRYHLKILRFGRVRDSRRNYTERVGGARAERVLVKTENGRVGSEISMAETRDKLGVSFSLATTVSLVGYDTLSSRMGSIEELRTEKL